VAARRTEVPPAGQEGHPHGASRRSSRIRAQERGDTRTRGGPGGATERCRAIDREREAYPPRRRVVSGLEPSMNASPAVGNPGGETRNYPPVRGACKAQVRPPACSRSAQGIPSVCSGGNRQQEQWEPVLHQPEQGRERLQRPRPCVYARQGRRCRPDPNPGACLERPFASRYRATGISPGAPHCTPTPLLVELRNWYHTPVEARHTVGSALPSPS
jgi:hypothetical protein